MTAYPDSLDVRPLTTWVGDLTPAHRRERALFSARMDGTLELLRRELTIIGCRRPVLEVAIPPDERNWRIDGRPRVNATAEHPGIVLSLPSSNVGPLRYATDTFMTWQDNLRAVALGMEALRRVDRYGITKRGEQYAGFRALPGGSGTASGLTYTDAVELVFRLAEMRPGVDTLEAAVRRAKRVAHPDANDGDRAAWNQLDQALSTIGRTEAARG